MTHLDEQIVAELLWNASTEHALLQEAQLIQHVPGACAQQRLTNLFKRRRDALRGK